MTYYIQTGLFSLLILILVYFNVRTNSKKTSFDYILFKALILATICATILDVMMYLVDGQPGAFWLTGNKLITSFYYIFNPLPCFIWSLYADHLIYKDEERIRKNAIWLGIPTLIVALLSILSLFNGFLFSIGIDNRYHRGPFFIVMAALSYLYLLHTVVLILRNRKLIQTKDLLPMLFFIVPPTIGGIVQVLFYGTSVLWMSVSFSILVIYTNIQNLSLATDHLTGLYNRRHLDSHLGRLRNIQSPDRKIAGMMIDLNDMKTINDRFGHKTGDEAIEQTAMVLQRSFRKDDFIARYGGDEFVIIFTVDSKDHLQEAVARIQANLQVFNKKNEFPFTLSLSIGFDLYDAGTDKNADDFIRRLDNKMYAAKQEYHQGS